MKNTVTTLVLMILLLSSNMAFGETKYDGNELLSDCNDYISAETFLDSIKDLSKDSIIQWYEKLTGAKKCYGLLLGMHDLNIFYQIYLKELGKKALFCIPEGVTQGQFAMVVIKYLNEHPELLHERDTMLIFKALTQAFPCK